MQLNSLRSSRFGKHLHRLHHLPGQPSSPILRSNIQRHHISPPNRRDTVDVRDRKPNDLA